jgi:hypothetical protein
MKVSTMLVSMVYYTLLSCSAVILNLEDGGDMFLRNVGSHTGYKELYPGSWQHS